MQHHGLSARHVSIAQLRKPLRLFMHAHHSC
jgi:hypothetical protein